MQKYTLAQIREMYLKFFESKNHLRLDSAPLIPHNDESLLLINSGMAQFKSYFSGQEIPPSKKITTCQKCIRTNDIENVGKTSRHATFFEMLGNFSFGDYFKFEAITWAWEFVTQILKLPLEKLFVTVYQDDTEAFDIWQNKIGLAKEKIFRMGKEDNFWEIGIGPCGPCSEIYFDRGANFGCSKKSCQPGCDCDRFVEIWNLVFTQFNRNADGSYSKLIQCNIDTGMGLERIASVMQGVNSIFDIDTAKIIIEKIARMAGVVYGENYKTDVSIRIITDHVKAVTFMISDDVFPSNEGRGYILRRLIRRAICRGKILGINEKFLTELAKSIIQIFGDAYQNLLTKQKQIIETILSEETKFFDTLSSGLNILYNVIEELKASGKNKISGQTVFKLYDTFGFPIEITKEIANENGLDVNEEEFKMELEKQKERARNALHNKNKNTMSMQLQEQLKNLDATKFVGYETEKIDDAKILAIVSRDELQNKFDAHDEFSLIFDKTPFFAESAGQISDTGILKTATGLAKIIDCQKILADKYEHKAKIIQGTIEINQMASLSVDSTKRLAIARNHTATHLLHKVLCEIVDQSVKQMGSYVGDNRLRFDFLCPKTIDKNTLQQVEDLVNEKILECLDVLISYKNIDEAIEFGATALFGEKYGKIVRVVNISDYSIELCSGIHLKNTSQVVAFKFISVGSISSGVKRIEALTGKATLDYFKNLENDVEYACEILKTDKKNLASKIKNCVDENNLYQEKIKILNEKIAEDFANQLIKTKKIVGSVNVIIHSQKNSDMNFLQLVSDKIKFKLNHCVIFLLNICDGKVNIIASATNDIDIHVGNLLKDIVQKFGGRGGGKKNFAQAGGIPEEKIDEFITELNKKIFG